MIAFLVDMSIQKTPGQIDPVHPNPQKRTGFPTAAFLEISPRTRPNSACLALAPPSET
jgi:hypothetical protein